MEDIDRFNKVGCFALTELAYGNNAVEMETTAHYDKETNEFVINTPNAKAQKYWITNGKCCFFLNKFVSSTNDGKKSCTVR